MSAPDKVEPAPVDVVGYADEVEVEVEGGQLGLAVPGESVELFKRPALPVPSRCVAHDRFDDCPR